MIDGFSITFVEDLTNKSTTYHFHKFKKAFEFLSALKKIGSRGYYCFWFSIK